MLARSKWHKRVTDKRVMAYAKESMFGLEQNGLCVRCGADAYGVEPDAREYRCGDCKHPTVYGAEELLMYLA